MLNRIRYAFRTAFVWLAEGKASWLSILCLALLGLAAYEIHIGSVEQRIRFLGTLTEFFGINCVAIGLTKIRRQFGLAPIRREVMAYFVRPAKIFRKQPGVNIVVNASLGISTSLGTAVVYAKQTGSVEERLGRLEELLENVRIETNEQNAALTGDIRKLKSTADEEAKARRVADEAGAQILIETMTGDVQLELVGLGYLCAGLFLSNLSQEIAKWLGT
jgi:hypothetical protein